MSLILAIEPDRRQAAKVARLIEQLRLDLVIGESADDALAALGSRVPDLVLTSQLLVPKDEAALADRLRELGAAGAHVQTLVIPVLRGDDQNGKKKGGRGLLGRLRGDRQHDEKNQDGCDPAVFAGEINDYLERGAAERAALAAAQADLEAAWAEQPAAPEPVADLAVAGPPEALSLDVLPAITSAPVASLAMDEPPVHAATGADPSGVGAWPAPAATGAPVPAFLEIDVHPDMVIEDPEALFGEFAAIPIKRDVPRPADVTPRRPDEDWEEIPLDVDEPGQTSGRPPAAETPAPAAHGVELTSELVDLDAFVRDLHTVPSSANAQPMIPVVDLSHVFAGDVALPEPTIVEERELLEDARATFEAEVAAVFGEGAFQTAEGPVEQPADVEAEAVGEPAADVTADLPRMEWPEFVAPQPMPTSTWVEPPPTDWRAAIDALPPPPSMAAPGRSDAAAPAPAALGPGWQDMLSAIRRDIDSLKPDEIVPTPAKPKSEFKAEPLVFPARPAVAASVLSEFDAQAAQRARESDQRVREAEQLAREAQDRARAAEEALRAAAATVVTSRIVEAAAPLPVDSGPSIFDARIETDLMAVAFSPIVPPRPVEPEHAASAVVESLESPSAEAVADQARAQETPYLTETGTAPAASDALAWLLNPSDTPPSADAGAPLASVAEGAVEATAEATVEMAAEMTGKTTAEMAAEVFAEAVEEAPVAVAAEATPAPPAPAMESRPVFTTPEPNSNRQRQGKSKKKRRHAQPPPSPPAFIPAIVHPPIPEWGFFDLQRAEFGPLLARLNQDTADLRALPLR